MTIPRSLLTLIALTACGKAESSPELYQFGSCDEMASYMEDVAITEAKWRNAWDFDFSIGMARNDVAFQSVEASADSGATSYSTTNLQEAGVDEADIIKTDGTYIYAVSGSSVQITRAWPADEASLVGAVELDASRVISGVYLTDDDSLIVVGSAWNQVETVQGAQDLPTSHEGATFVTIVDVGDPSSPGILRETFTQGELASSRRIGSKLYVVTQGTPTPTHLGDSLREQKRRIRDADTRDWLPWRVDFVRPTMSEEDAGSFALDDAPAVDCTDVWGSDKLTGTTFSSALVVDLDDPTGVLQGEMVIGAADTIYASSESLYVAYSEWLDGPFGTRDDRIDSVVHKFDIRGEHPSYRGTVKVQGALPSQFAMSEQDQILRMATTDTNSWTSSVWTVEESGGALAVLDEEHGIAPEEELHGVRFVGDIGFLVTFPVGWASIPMIDPLFTIDLSDPGNIEVLGELEVAGWSDYLHPLPDDRLLAVGIHDPDSYDLGVSLFDVSDLRNPRLADKVAIDTVGSEALVDHHAFNYFADQGTLALPMGWDSTVALSMVAVEGETLTVLDPVEAPTAISCGQARRSVFMDDVIWAMGQGGLVAETLSEPREQVADIPFDDCGW